MHVNVRLLQSLLKSSCISCLLSSILCSPPILPAWNIDIYLERKRGGNEPHTKDGGMENEKEPGFLLSSWSCQTHLLPSSRFLFMWKKINLFLCVVGDKPIRISSVPVTCNQMYQPKLCQLIRIISNWLVNSLQPMKQKHLSNKWTKQICCVSNCIEQLHTLFFL